MNWATRLGALLDRLAACGKVSRDSRVTFIDDGSSDATWSLIEAEASAHPWVSGISDRAFAARPSSTMRIFSSAE